MILPPRVLTVLTLVAAEHGVPVADLFSRDTHKPISEARREAMRAVRSLEWGATREPPSYPQIGRWFGRDHTTVLHACKGMRGEEQLELGLAA